MIINVQYMSFDDSVKITMKSACGASTIICMSKEDSLVMVDQLIEKVARAAEREYRQANTR